MVLLIGLDAASDFSKFGYALGYYEHGRVRIKKAGLVRALDQNDALSSVVAPALRAAANALIAIDAPLGWPASLADELSSHRAGEPFAAGKDAMFHRATDGHVYDLIGKKPLEVGADKIARAAHSALSALQCLRDESGKKIPLVWDKEFSGLGAIEVYPAGTLKARGLPDSRYKKAEQLNVRRVIAASLAGEIDGLEIHVDGSADVFDACLCLIAAKDYLDGLAPCPEDMRLAKREGWIWVRNP